MPLVDEMEAELRIYWKISKDARDAAFRGDEADKAELADEFVSFGNHVISPTLRARCLADAAALRPSGRNLASGA